MQLHARMTHLYEWIFTQIPFHSFITDHQHEKNRVIKLYMQQLDFRSSFQGFNIVTLLVWNHPCKILYALKKYRVVATELWPYKIVHQRGVCFSAHQNACRYYSKKCIHVYISVSSGLQPKTLLLKQGHALSRVSESYFITFNSLNCSFR